MHLHAATNYLLLKTFGCWAGRPTKHQPVSAELTQIVIYHEIELEMLLFLTAQLLLLVHFETETTEAEVRFDGDTLVRL